LFVKTYDRKTSDEFIDFIEEIRTHWHYRKIAIILDNARIHKSKKTKNALGRYKSIDFVFLPTNSPELNRIEGVWNNMQNEAINNHKFEEKDGVEIAVVDWVNFHNNERKEIK
jgi:transposase